MLSRQKLIISLTLLLSAASAHAGPLVYVISAGLTGNLEFGTVDLTTGAFKQIGPTEPDGYFGLAPGLNGSLVSLTYAANLDSINPATGVPTRIGPTGLSSCVVPSPSCGPTSAFSLDGLGGKIYATDFQNSLYAVSPLTGAATLLAQHTGIPSSPFALGSQNPDGTLNFADEAIWGAGGKLYATYDAFVFNPTSSKIVKVVVAPELYGINPLTGLATAIGHTDLGIGGVADVNGKAYAFNDITLQITSIDLSSGKTSSVSSFDSAAGVI